MNLEEISSLALRDPLSFGLFYINLLENKKWEVDSRRWSHEIYDAVNPWKIEKYPQGVARRVVVTKSTQAGISTWALTKMFHFSTHWPVRIMYTMPRQQDLIDLVTTRVDPMIAESPYLRAELGQPDSVHAKKIGSSYVYFMEMTVEPRSLPGDAIFIDEVDLSDPDFMATAVNRLDASRWQLFHYLSTPTVPNYGIHGLYNSSDMRQWLVKCPKCGHEQPIEWEVNLRVVGAANNPTNVFYGCGKCDAEISVEHMQTGRWVAQHPHLTEETVGYHIHQMLTTPARKLYTIFRDPQTKLVEFYRKRLGMPYEIGGGSLERDDFLTTCFDEPYEPELAHDGKSTYYMGCDQGNELQVIICKEDRNNRRPKVVHVELIPMNKGFDRLSQLIQLFRIKRGVIDGNPNRHGAQSQVIKFPGRILLADYSEHRETWKSKKGGLPKQPTILTGVTINRTSGFDDLMDSIKKGEWRIYGEPPGLHPEIELLIDHVTSLKRDIETRRQASGEVQVAVWRKLRADHLAHAWLYMKIARELDRGKNLKVAVIGKQVDDGQEQNDDEVYMPKKDDMIDIISILAEVPAEQLSSYLTNIEDEEFQPEFPLSFKLEKLAERDFDAKDVIWCMEFLISDASKKSK